MDMWEVRIHRWEEDGSILRLMQAAALTNTYKLLQITRGAIVLTANHFGQQHSIVALRIVYYYFFLHTTKNKPSEGGKQGEGNALKPPQEPVVDLGRSAKELLLRCSVQPRLRENV
jgi:hypothetical protein